MFQAHQNSLSLRSGHIVHRYRKSVVGEGSTPSLLAS